MKAVRIHEHGGPEVLRWEDVADPSCGNNEVLVGIKAAAMNHLDIWVRSGLPGVPFPVIMGSDGSGIITEVGENVNEWKIGDEVIIQPGTYCGECDKCKAGQENYCSLYGILGESEDGTQCELIAVHSNNLARKPSHITFRRSCCFPTGLLDCSCHAYSTS
jgi:NADPH:quinone reductase-like Zn-dependent oxidoreductase